MSARRSGMRAVTISGSKPSSSAWTWTLMRRSASTISCRRQVAVWRCVRLASRSWALSWRASLAHRPEDPLLEEPFDQREEGALSKGRSTSVRRGRRRRRSRRSWRRSCRRSSGGPCGPCLASTAAGGRWRSGPSREQVAAARAAVGLASWSLLEAGLAGGEQLLGDQRCVRLLGDDPFLLGAQAGAAAVLACGGKSSRFQTIRPV